MIYKGIVENVSGKQVKVRIPKLHKSVNAIGSTAIGQLSDACICSFPGVTINLQINDIVFVDFEDTLNEAPVIIGTLANFDTTSRCNMSMNDLKANITARLPKDTQIGDITYAHLDKLTGITSNIQSKFTELVRLIESQESRIQQLEEKIAELSNE